MGFTTYFECKYTQNYLYMILVFELTQIDLDSRIGRGGWHAEDTDFMDLRG